ncbi:hypothetical protein [Robertkochia sediminum]|uniref:hypothetical protein n=1 Tax=Robertkochia sediminum TaxID=2785326 RepID=UPI0019321338|nr:hypothetical protein [Robertkochia sediminum]MBL7472571.1 hypothetical protein [Robertkochia sediminum]
MRITKRDLKFFLIGAITILIIDMIIDRESSEKAFREGFFATAILGNTSGKLKALDLLSNTIEDQYNIENVDIELNNLDELIITLKDSDLKTLSPSEKAAMAHEIGELARSLDPDLEKLEKGHVQFVSEAKLGMLKTGDTETFTMFE